MRKGWDHSSSIFVASEPSAGRTQNLSKHILIETEWVTICSRSCGVLLQGCQRFWSVLWLPPVSLVVVKMYWFYSVPGAGEGFQLNSHSTESWLLYMPPLIISILYDVKSEAWRLRNHTSDGARAPSRHSDLRAFLSAVMLIGPMSDAVLVHVLPALQAQFQWVCMLEMKKWSS